MIREEELERECSELDCCTSAVRLAERTLASAGINSPRFEAQLLVALALHVDRTAVVARTAPVRNAYQKAELYRLLAERVRRVPLAYLRGSQEFYGLEFAVSPETLIPRPETELLVDFAIQILSADCTGRATVMIDVGAGSGCISIAALKHCPGAQSLAVDISPGALGVARMNSVTIGVSDRIRFIQANLLDSIRQGVQLVVSNPPYIASGLIADLEPDVASHEPRLALDGGPDGLSILRQIARSAASVLDRGGWLAVECAQGQSLQVSELFKRGGLASIRIVNDLAGIQRMVCGMRPFAE